VSDLMVVSLLNSASRRRRGACRAVGFARRSRAAQDTIAAGDDCTNRQIGRGQGRRCTTWGAPVVGREWP
jgi:hypothetical protein